MAYDVKLIGAKLRRWENYLKDFRLPQWDELPDMDLYMIMSNSSMQWLQFSKIRVHFSLHWSCQ